MAPERTTPRAPRTPPLILESLETRRTPSAAWPAQEAGVSPRHEDGPVFVVDSHGEPAADLAGPRPLAPAGVTSAATRPDAAAIAWSSPVWTSAATRAPDAAFVPNTTESHATAARGGVEPLATSGYPGGGGLTPGSILTPRAAGVGRAAAFRSMVDPDGGPGETLTTRAVWTGQVGDDAHGHDAFPLDTMTSPADGPAGGVSSTLVPMSPFPGHSEPVAFGGGPGVGRPGIPSITAVVLASSHGGAGATSSTGADANPAGANLSAFARGGAGRGGAAVAWGARPGDLGPAEGSGRAPVAVGPAGRGAGEAAIHAGDEAGDGRGPDAVADVPEPEAAGPEPEAAGPRTAFSPFDRATIEHAIDRVLDELAGVGAALPEALGPPGLAPAALALTAAALAIEVARRRRRKAGDDAPWPAEVGGSFPGLPSVSGGA